MSNFDLDKQEQFADRQMNLLSNSNHNYSKDRELQRDAMESINTVNNIITPNENEIYTKSNRNRERQKKLAEGASTVEIASLTKKLIDRSKIQQNSDLNAIMQIISKFNSDMNINEAKFNNNDNISVMSSISHRTNPINNFYSNKIESFKEPHSLTPKSTMLNKNVSNESFDINIRMNLTSKEANAIQIADRESSIDLINLRSNSVNMNGSDDLDFDRKDSKISVTSGITTNSIPKSPVVGNYGKSGKSNSGSFEKDDQKNPNPPTEKYKNKSKIMYKKEIEVIEKEMKIQRRKLMDFKMKLKERKLEKEKLERETHGMTQNEIIGKAKSGDKGRDQWKSLLPVAEQLVSVNVKIKEIEAMIENILDSQKELMHKKESFMKN